MVRSTRGGGTRSVKYKRDMKLSEIFNDMIERYWPKTSREFGTKANTIFHIRDCVEPEFICTQKQRLSMTFWRRIVLRMIHLMILKSIHLTK